MRRLLVHTLCAFLLFPTCSLFAQRLFGNEWIHYDQQYFKVQVASTGVYQIHADQLRDAGVPLNDIPSRAFQLFRRGQEVAIELSEHSEKPIGNKGYIRFYGEKNDGARDTALYVAPDAMPHGFYNLYSDTSAYYLTWRTDGGSGKRIETANTNHSRTSVPQYHIAEQLQVNTSHYLPGRFYPKESNYQNGSILTSYDHGEGWTGPELLKNKATDIAIPLRDLAEHAALGIEIEMLLAGRAAGSHDFDIYDQNAGEKLAAVHFRDYNFKIAILTVNPAKLTGRKVLNLTLIPTAVGSSASISYIKIRYPQKSVASSKEDQQIFHFNPAKTSWQCKGSETFTFFDCTKPEEIRKLAQTGDHVSTDSASKVIGVRQYLPISNLQRIHFKNINPLEVDYLIITHPLMRVPVHGRDPVYAYEQYRASAAGGGYHTLSISSEEVYDAFNYGDRGPLGLKNLIAWLHRNGKLRFVLLIGKSIDPQRARKLSNPAQTDMVPNAGWPGSDIALTTGANPLQAFPPVPIGRINASFSYQVWDYLQKVKAFEAEPAAAEWRKRILHLSGGRSRQELALFRQYVRDFEATLSNSALAPSVQTISKVSDDPVESVQAQVPVNRGVALLTIFGHSAPDVTDIDIGFASDEKNGYENQPRYPAVIVNGCAAGSVFYADHTLSTDWLFAPDRGAILFLAHTFNGTSTALKKYTDHIYEVLADNAFTSKPFGSIQQEAIKRMLSRNTDIFDRITSQQMVLHGDPAVRIFPAELPDYTFDPGSVRIKPNAGKDSLAIQVIVKNHGRYLPGRYTLLFRRVLENKQLFEYSQAYQAPRYADTLIFKIPNTSSVLEKDLFEITIDSENRITEENELNNSIVLHFSEIENRPAEPEIAAPLLLVTLGGRQIRNKESISPNSQLHIQIVENASTRARADTSGILIWLKPLCDGCGERRLYLGNARFYSSDFNHFHLETPVGEMLPDGEYLLTVRVKSESGYFTPDYQIIFRIERKPAISFVQISPNPSSRIFIFRIDIEGTAPPDDLLLDIFDLSGKKLRQIRAKPEIGINEVVWEPGKLPAGTYIYKFSNPGNTLPISQEAAGLLSGRLFWNP